MLGDSGKILSSNNFCDQSFVFVKFNSILRMQEFSSKVVAQFFSTLTFETSRHHKDLELESQHRAREVDALVQQLSKAAADTWPKLVTLNVQREC